MLECDCNRPRAASVHGPADGNRVQNPGALEGQREAMVSQDRKRAKPDFPKPRASGRGGNEDLAEDRSPWRILAIFLGLFSVCCGLPAIALLVVIFGGATAVLTGAVAVGIGAASVAGILVAYHAVRRRAAQRRPVAVPLELRVAFSEDPPELR